MANAQVEKLKALGLRHGEKAVVGLSAVLCLLFLFFAATKETIPLTPEQVDTAAKTSRSNLDRRQDLDDILKRLEEEQIKNPNFVKIVDAQEKDALDPNAFRVERPWVTPEPGAGLIRDQPELLAPTELLAYAGRGGASIFKLDDAGKRILEDPNKKVDEGVQKRRLGKPRRRRSAGMSGGMAGMMGGSAPRRRRPRANPAQAAADAKKEADRKAKELQRVLAGKADAADKDAKEETEEDTDGPWVEVTKGLRWVAITGVLDHKKLVDNYVAALKNPAAAPNYKELEVQRQSIDSDGKWSEWEDVDLEKNRLITFNIPEEEEELTPDTVRIDSLVDPLPFLKAGFWEKVHVVSLVPKEKREIPKPAANEMAGEMGMPGMPGMPGTGGMSMSTPPGMSSMSMPSMPSMAGMSGMPGMSGSMGGEAENTNFQKTDAPTVMVRSLDFTVDPDTTYRFRLRIVVFNPNYKREDVSPGIDTTSLELKGPWSEATNEVTMPPDVNAYALNKTPFGQGSKRKDQIHFQLVRWNPDDGMTVVRQLDYGPGQIIGEPLSTPYPSTDSNSPAKSKQVDYNSHQIMLDQTGGPQPVAQVGVVGAPLDVPAMTLLLRADGSVVLHDQAVDQLDPVRKDTAENYAREIKESGKTRKNSQGSMYGGMMPGGMSMPSMPGMAR